MFFTLLTKSCVWQIREPRLDNISSAFFEIQESGNMVTLTPVLPREVSVFERKNIFIELFKTFLSQKRIRRYSIMTSTCRAVPYLRYLTPEFVIYDQNDEEAVIHPELFLEMHEYADSTA